MKSWMTFGGAGPGAVLQADERCDRRRDAGGTKAVMRDTIFALATAPGRAAVAVVRLSGPGRRRGADGAGRPLPPRARRAACGPLRSRRRADRSTRPWCCGSPARHSYTGEDVAELHLHGGPAVVEAVTRGPGRRGPAAWPSRASSPAAPSRTASWTCPRPRPSPTWSTPRPRPSAARRWPSSAARWPSRYDRWRDALHRGPGLARGRDRLPRRGTARTLWPPAPARRCARLRGGAGRGAERPARASGCARASGSP